MGSSPRAESTDAIEHLTETVLALELRLGEPRLVTALFHGAGAIARAGGGLTAAEVGRAGAPLAAALEQLRSGERAAGPGLAALVLDVVLALRALSEARARAEAAAVPEPVPVAPAIVRPPPLGPHAGAAVPPLAPAIVRPPHIAPSPSSGLRRW